VLSVILGWPERATTFLMGVTVITYTVAGGIKAVTWSDVQQMCIIFLGLVVALVTVIVPAAFTGVVWRCRLSGGRRRPPQRVTTHFDWNDRYNIWGGLFGGTFLFLSYFGCDNRRCSAISRGAPSVRAAWACCSTLWPRSPCSSSFCSSAPMVFCVLPVHPAAVLFQQAELARIQSHAEFEPMANQYTRPSSAAARPPWRWWKPITAATRAPNTARRPTIAPAQREIDAARAQAAHLVEQTGGEKGFSDTNYIFLSS